MNEEAIRAISIALWAIGGAISFGGFFSLSIDEEKKEVSSEEFVDSLLFSGFFTAMSNVFKNWGKKKEATWLSISGVLLLAIGSLVWFLK